MTQINLYIIAVNVEMKTHYLLQKMFVYPRLKSFNHIINKYTKLDPTLPRVNNILCPNPECPTNKDGAEREIIYIRYDDVNMKYVYLCTNDSCNAVWKINEHA
jgi:aspartate carbamoyltransferase regulatory subunit